MKPTICVLNDSNKAVPISEEWVMSCYLEITEENQSDQPDLNIILLNDDDHTSLNIKHLGHDTSTDIITFEPMTDLEPLAEIYINLDRALANAKEFNATAEEELKRLVIHGVLHLCGQGDKTPAEKEAMTSLENTYLKRFM